MEHGHKCHCMITMTERDREREIERDVVYLTKLSVAKIARCGDG